MKNSYEILIVGSLGLPGDQLPGMLRDLDTAVLIERDFERGVKIAHEKRFAMVVLGLTESSIGLEVVRQFRESRLCVDIPFICLVANGTLEESCYLDPDLGLVDVVHQPVSPQWLKARARVYLELAKAKEQANNALAQAHLQQQQTEQRNQRIYTEAQQKLEVLQEEKDELFERYVEMVKMNSELMHQKVNNVLSKNNIVVQQLSNRDKYRDELKTVIESDNFDLLLGAIVNHSIDRNPT